MNDPLNGQKRLKVAIELPKSRVSKALLDALADSAARLGHEVTRNPKEVSRDPEAVTFIWNGKGKRKPAGKLFYCENGWLPRWEFQIAEGGINASSALAPYQPGAALSYQELHFVEKRLERLRKADVYGQSAPYAYAETGLDACEKYSEDYILVPLQMPQDTNMRHVPRRLRKCQGFVDYLGALDSPLPLLFKQHPMDANHGNEQLLLRMPRKGDLVHPHRDGNVHQLLKSGKCKAVVTLNSNVVHDGILWGVPALAFGRGVWGGPGGGPGPFVTSLERGWDYLLGHLRDPAVVTCRREYAYWLFKQQWTVERAENTGYVSRLLAGRL